MRRAICWAAVLVALLALAACASQTQPPAKVDLKVPWPDHESVSYVIQDQTGKQLGTAEMQVAKEGEQYTLRHAYEIGSTKDTMAVQVRASDLKPIGEHREINQPNGTVVIDTSYRDGKLSVKAKTPDGKEQSAETDVPADAYDNDEALFFWRTLPYADGFKFTYTNIVAANVLKPQATLSVVGREKVSVPAGEYDCWKVQLEAGQAKQTLWYAVAAPHYLVKYDNTATVFLLSKAQ